MYGEIINSAPCDEDGSYAIDPTSNTFYTVCNLLNNPQLVSVDIPSGKVINTFEFSNPGPAFDPLLCYLK